MMKTIELEKEEIYCGNLLLVNKNYPLRDNSTAHQIKKRCFGGQYKHAQMRIQLPSEPVFEFGGIFLCDGRI